eukprot:scaffold568_cov376-Prasinococcus_capsulatus_cf.AAC.11
MASLVAAASATAGGDLPRPAPKDRPTCGVKCVSAATSSPLSPVARPPTSLSVSLQRWRRGPARPCPPLRLGHVERRRPSPAAPAPLRGRGEARAGHPGTGRGVQ